MQSLCPLLEQGTAISAVLPVSIFSMVQWKDRYKAIAIFNLLGN